MSLTSKDDKVFDDKSLSDILKDIYSNSVNKKATIDDVMTSFLALIQVSKDVGYIGSVVKDLLDIGIKNDEQLVKVATIVQRLIISDGATEGMFSDLEKDELLRTFQEAEDTSTVIDSDVEKLEANVAKIKKEIQTEDE